MSTPTGLFDLQTPRDLLRKLQHEYEKLKESPLDQYNAFNFFVTAEHMLDWTYPDSQKVGDNRRKREEERGKHEALGVCWDIASGAKHFKVLGKGHDSVKNFEVQEGAFDASDFSDDFQLSALMIIELHGKAAKELGRFMEVCKLAGIVLEYWEQHFTT